MSTGSHGQSAAPSTLPTATELAKDTGWIGQALRTVPKWLLREADRWALDQLRSMERHNDPTRLPFPDPWSHLVAAPAIPRWVKDVCRAAQSQLLAYRHLLHMVYGTASISQDWHSEALEALARGDEQAYADAGVRIANALSEYTDLRPEIAEVEGPDTDTYKEAVAWSKRRRAQLVHRLGRFIRHTEVSASRP